MSLRPMGIFGVGHGRVRPDVEASQRSSNKAPDARCLDAAEPPPRGRWSDLPDHILEDIMACLLAEQQAADAAVWLPISSVCRSWRTAGRRVFLKEPWAHGPLLVHPSQLFTLCPPGCAPAGTHIRCSVRREPAAGGLGGRLHKFTLSQGVDASAEGSRFLLAAVQESKQRYALYTSRAAAGRPVGRLAANVMRTAYELTLTTLPWSTEDAPYSGAYHSAPHSGAGGGGPVHARHPPSPPLGAAPSPTAAGARGGAGAGGGGGLASQLRRLRLPSAGGGGGSPPAPPGSPELQRSWSSHGASPRPAAEAAAAVATAGGEGCGGEAAGRLAARGGPLARVQYKLRVRGMMLPRRMAVELPCPPHVQAARAAADAAAVAGGSPSDAVLGAGGGGGGAAHEHPPAGAQSEDVPVHAEEVAGGEDDLAAWPDQGARQPWSGAQQLPPAQASPPDAAQQPGRTHSGRSASGGGDGGGGGALARAVSLDAPPPNGAPAAARPLRLCSKPPHWNEALRCWCLNFQGRVKLASVKNFQLTAAGSDDDRIVRALGGAGGGHGGGGAGGGPVANGVGGSSRAVVMQFGKVEANLFVLDFNPTLITATQALAVALSAFETKLLL